MRAESPFGARTAMCAAVRFICARTGLFGLTKAGLRVEFHDRHDPLCRLEDVAREHCVHSRIRKARPRES